jgi:hypothetical protein
VPEKNFGFCRVSGPIRHILYRGGSFMNAHAELERILRQTQLQLRAYIRSCGVSLQDIDDLAQDVYFAYYRGMEKMPEVRLQKEGWFGETASEWHI